MQDSHTMIYYTSVCVYIYIYIYVHKVVGTHIHIRTGCKLIQLADFQG